MRQGSVKYHIVTVFLKRGLMIYETICYVCIALAIAKKELP